MSTTTEKLTDDIAAMLHYRGRMAHPRSHPKTQGGACDECIESARQAVEFFNSAVAEASFSWSPGWRVPIDLRDWPWSDVEDAIRRRDGSTVARPRADGSYGWPEGER